MQCQWQMLLRSRSRLVRTFFEQETGVSIRGQGFKEDNNNNLVPEIDIHGRSSTNIHRQVLGDLADDKGMEHAHGQCLSCRVDDMP